MKKVLGVLAFACIFLPCWADIGVGFSGLFSIDNVSTPPASPSQAINPYTNKLVLLRGQLHAHSKPDLNNLGDPLTDEEFAQKYKDCGYDFVALTNHNLVSGVLNNFSGLAWAPYSVEITHGTPFHYPVIYDSHVLAIGLNPGTTFENVDYPTDKNIAFNTIQRVNNVRAHGGLAFVAHPDSFPYGLTVNELTQVFKESNPNGMGIFTPRNDSQVKWNKVLGQLGKFVCGYVEDDYHPDNMSDQKLANTWVAVPGQSNDSWEMIKQKLATGNFYCYWTDGASWPVYETPPQIKNFTVLGNLTDPIISFTLSGVPSGASGFVEFIGYGGKKYTTLQTNLVGNQTYKYSCSGQEKFVRVLITLKYSFCTLKIASQPIMINKIGNSGIMLSKKDSTLILNYLEYESLPSACPPNGYVGDVYNVTTSDGICPPNAVLTLSFMDEDLSTIGDTEYLAIYRFDVNSNQWIKIGGSVNVETRTISAPITTLGIYAVSADLPADTTPPEVFIDNPPSGSIVNSDVKITATVNDDLGAWRVRFYMNDYLLGEDTSAVDGWSINLKASNYCQGDWTLKAEAEDNAGNVGTVEIPIYIVSPTPRPTISITSPATGSTVEGSFTVVGACWDDVYVTSVSLYADNNFIGFASINNNSWSANLNASQFGAGWHSLKAVVADSFGNQAETAISINVSIPETLISGKLDLDGYDGNAVYNGKYRATLKIYKSDNANCNYPDETVNVVLTPVSGTLFSFSASIPQLGSGCRLLIKPGAGSPKDQSARYHWLATRVNNVDLSGTTANLGTILMKNGDMNDDNIADAFDFTILLQAYDISEDAALGESDLNDDGNVDAFDLTILMLTYDTAGDACN